MTPLKKNTSNEIKSPIDPNVQAEEPQTEDSNTTLASSEKPPEFQSFKSIVAKLNDSPMLDPTSRSTFLLNKEIYERKSTSDDDATTDKGNTTATKYCNSVRMTMMLKLPTKKMGCTDEEAPIIAIQKMNEMIKALANKLPCRIGPWTHSNQSTLKETDLLTELQEEVNFVESYVYDYNRFISPGKTCYV